MTCDKCQQRPAITSLVKKTSALTEHHHLCVECLKLEGIVLVGQPETAAHVKQRAVAELLADPGRYRGLS